MTYFEKYFQTERNKALSFSLSLSDAEKAILQAIQAIQVSYQLSLTVLHEISSYLYIFKFFFLIR